MKVHIIQCLCPERHCILAVAYEHPTTSNADALTTARREFAERVAGGMNPWCGLCGSHDLTFEVGVTKWEDLAQALPYLKETEEQCRLTRMRLMAEKN